MDPNPSDIVLVTGCNSFIGLHTTQVLLQKDFKGSGNPPPPST